MTLSDYERLTTALLASAQGIMTSKRPGYTRGDVDVLANFKNVAKAAGVTPAQAWTIYFLKHIDAITTHMTQPALPVSEAMEGRFGDALNYLTLGYALLCEGKGLDHAASARIETHDDASARTHAEETRRALQERLYGVLGARRLPGASQEPTVGNQAPDGWPDRGHDYRERGLYWTGEDGRRHEQS